jgi:5-methylcytosine-specific restriction endonuclease McrA
MIERVLKLDVAGRPISWISREAGALLYCRDQVAWEAGEEELVLRGGYSRITGLRSVLRVNSIVAVTAIDKACRVRTGVPGLTNARLFRRDGYMCLYCGEVLSARLLTRDHIVPVSLGGLDTWENVATACRACNHRKANRLLEDLGMTLLAVPYAPNRAEGLILENRHILCDQMAFLQTHVGSSSRLRVA